MSIVLEPKPRHVNVLAKDGDLRVPVSRDLEDQLAQLILRGERRIVIDLAETSSIDAAGVGVLTRLYNRLAELDGALRIVRANAAVREVLQRLGLFELLHGD